MFSVFRQNSSRIPSEKKDDRGIILKFFKFPSEFLSKQVICLQDLLNRSVAQNSRFLRFHSMIAECRWVFNSGWASSKLVGKICPLVLIGLTELPNSGWAKANPAHSLAASLHWYFVKLQSSSATNRIVMILFMEQNNRGFHKKKWVPYGKNFLISEVLVLNQSLDNAILHPKFVVFGETLYLFLKDPYLSLAEI